MSWFGKQIPQTEENTMENIKQKRLARWSNMSFEEQDAINYEVEVWKSHALDLGWRDLVKAIEETKIEMVVKRGLPFALLQESIEDLFAAWRRREANKKEKEQENAAEKRLALIEQRLDRLEN